MFDAMYAQCISSRLSIPILYIFSPALIIFFITLKFSSKCCRRLLDGSMDRVDEESPIFKQNGGMFWRLKKYFNIDDGDGNMPKRLLLLKG